MGLDMTQTQLPLRDSELPGDFCAFPAQHNARLSAGVFADFDVRP